MATWRDEYMQALSARDEREKSSYERISEEFIGACKLPSLIIPLPGLMFCMKDTELLERTAALEAEKAASESKSEAATSKDLVVPATANDGTAQIRSDLAEALRSNGSLKTRVTAAEKELLILRAKTKADTKLIEDLTKERAILVQKVKDRGEELQGKAKFLVV